MRGIVKFRHHQYPLRLQTCRDDGLYFERMVAEYMPHLAVDRPTASVSRQGRPAPAHAGVNGLCDRNVRDDDAIAYLIGHCGGQLRPVAAFAERQRAISSAIGRIVASALLHDGRLAVLVDRTMTGNPAQWGEAVVRCHDDFDADDVVVEVNFGGDMTTEVVKQAAERRASARRTRVEHDPHQGSLGIARKSDARRTHKSLI
jgi:hypothetical protein